MSETIHLIRGDDLVLVNAAVKETVDELVGEADRSLVLEELAETHYRRDAAFDLGPLVDAAQTPPFLTDHRVVVARELAAFSKAADVAALVDYLNDPLPTTRLVLVWERGPSAARLGPPPKSLVAAVAAAGGRDVKTSVGSGKAATKWMDTQFAQAAVRLDVRAKRLVSEQLGEDRSRVGALLDVLASTYGDDGTLSEDDVRPFLGEAGGAPPWDLTDAIADGDMAKAVAVLQRMVNAGGKHALQVLAGLQGHYERLLRLDGADVRDEKDAAALLGMKGSTFPAKKALQQSRRLGGDKVARAVDLLGRADLDLRGATALPSDTVLEVLVARLAQLSR
ncbi:MAG: DNA polymerase III subunit delta [Acidimicrobiia bacterium]|nr:DNA polymerase III subunit delta [Acidimicrobiia bacterium]